ncbi:hypothetical protein PIB30_067375 [Stylosanthes scabra]|uniref:Uncharacterized protein n=1 Tax=Stylosanthes scabra TaxID=79078 RepID=A0ABU6VLJ2_9FABA|nr:hypothetical protein [Stylosanthes scabra]
MNDSVHLPIFTHQYHRSHLQWASKSDLYNERKKHFWRIHAKPNTAGFIEIEKSMRKAKKDIRSKDGLEKACKSGDSTKKKECKAEKKSYSHRIGANLDSLNR